MTVYMWTVADDKNNTNESSLFNDYEEAREDARDRRGIVIEYRFEMDDSEMVDDFTSDDDEDSDDSDEDSLTVVDYDEDGDPIYELK